VRPLPLLFILFALSADNLSAQDPARPTLTTARKLRALPVEDAERKYPVRLRGVVTHKVTEGTFFVQDDTGGTYIHAQMTNFTAEAGQQVEVEGVTDRGLSLTGIVPTSFRIVGTAPLPAARVVDYETLASGVFNYEWVEVRGTVRAFRSAADGHGVLTLGLGNGRLESLPDRATPAEAERLIDASVRVTGLATGVINDKRQLVAPHLRIDTLTAFQVVQPAPEDPFALPIKC